MTARTTTKSATTAKRTTTTRPKATQDRRPKNPARSQAQGEDVRFVYDDVEYTIPQERVRDLELLEATEDRRLVTAVRGYIGRAEWEAFKEANRGDDGIVDAGALEGLLNELMRALGNS